RAIPGPHPRSASHNANTLPNNVPTRIDPTSTARATTVHPANRNPAITGRTPAPVAGSHQTDQAADPPAPGRRTTTPTRPPAPPATPPPPTSRRPPTTTRPIRRRRPQQARQQRSRDLWCPPGAL